jgi:hypothetical protein
LRSHSDDFLTSLTEKLLTYALGRGLEPPMRLRSAESSGRAPAHYSFSALIQGSSRARRFR